MRIEYLRAHHDPASGDIAGLFAERAADYRAVVERVPEPGLATAIARVLAERAAAALGPFVVPDGLPPDWLAALPPAIELAADTRRSRRPNSTGWPGS
jgi:L-lactate dehydrogenase complex protein LldG